MNTNLIDYIRRARSAGWSDEQIREDLLEAGWTQKEVLNALEETHTIVSTPPRPPGQMKFFSYAPNLPLIIRIVSVILFFGGAASTTAAVFGLFAFIGAGENVPIFLLSRKIGDGILALFISNGLARLRRWAFYLFAILVAYSFAAGIPENRLAGSFLGLVAFLLISRHYKRFE